MKGLAIRTIYARAMCEQEDVGWVYVPLPEPVTVQAGVTYRIDLDLLDLPQARFVRGCPQLRDDQPDR